MPQDLETTTFAPTSGAPVWASNTAPLAPGLVVLCSTRRRQPEHMAPIEAMPKMFLIDFTGCSSQPNARLRHAGPQAFVLKRQREPGVA
jgi:hypothetical protein